MTDRAMLFSRPMIRALIDGRKSQTRRVLYRKTKNLGSARFDHRYPSPRLDMSRPDRMPGESWTLSSWAEAAPGDRIWVRESWRTFGTLDELSPTGLWPRPHKGVGIAFEAGGGLSIGPKEGGATRHCDYGEEARPELRGCLRASMHLPRWGSRLTLIVENVRVQRLQEISEEDAAAEGIERIDDPRGAAWRSYETSPGGLPHPHAAVPNASPVTSYRELWTSLHGADSWLADPWVAAISFRVIMANIDDEEARA